jgi:hypothetical protein
MLVDTVAQYSYGLPASSGARFEQILREHDPIYATAITPVIQYQYRGSTHQLQDYAAAVWACFRCCILHESHVMLCGVISGHAPIMQQQDGLTRYANGNPCPTLVLDPGKFLTSVETLFDHYISRLRNPHQSNDRLRRDFAKKFRQSFGVSIPSTL